MVLEYYLVLRSVLRNKPQLRSCLTRCGRCGIFFFTHPSNAKRPQRIGCPFGCREAHRRQESTRRSVACNRTPEGKRKKSALNQKRRGPKPALLERVTQPEVTVVPELDPEVITWDEVMVEHVLMVGSLIEGKRLSRQKLLEMLTKKMRQHTHCRRTRLEYTVAWLNEQPP